MASYVQVSNLDFQQIKASLKEYLRSQTDFTSYDFEGSAMNVLLDVLAYNTYYTAFNANMVVKDSADLKQSIKSLLMTRKGERLFNSEIGTNLTDLLFEPLDFGTASIIRDEIITVLSNYEPRIDILRLEVNVSYESNGYEVDLVYEIVGRDDVPVNVEFFLESAR